MMLLTLRAEGSSKATPSSKVLTLTRGELNTASETLNGMLGHAFATLEGCHLLWHIVAPPPPFHSSFCFSLSHFVPDLV